MAVGFWTMETVYCAHQPRLFRYNPGQQSAVDEAAPRCGTHCVRHRWNSLVAFEPQTGALAQHSERLLQKSPAGLHAGGAAQTPEPLQVSPVQHVAPLPQLPPVPTHGCTQTPEEFRTSPAQHSELLRAAMPEPAQVVRQVSVELVDVPTQ